MVVTRAELHEVVEQVNKKFAELENRIKELETAKKQPVKKKPATKENRRAQKGNSLHNEIQIF